MVTKLTLTVEEDVIRKAKQYCKDTGMSLSELIEKYLEMITDKHIDKDSLSPKLRRIVGVVKLPKDFDEKKALDFYLTDKHL